MTNSTEIINAAVIWQEDGTPYSPAFEDVYFSREGGLAETHHVFLQGNDLLQRWQNLDAALQADDSYGVFTIVELGFGTGLNFLCTWRLWQQAACQRLRLHYISCEKHPMIHADLSRALAQWPELSAWRDPLLASYPDHSAGYHRLPLQTSSQTMLQRPVILDLYYGDALTLLRSQANAAARVDAWYLDGFTPSRNMDLWSEELLQLLAERTRCGGTLASYSVTGRVVRALRSRGFTIEKRPGFGSKREMLVAMKSAPEDQVSPKAGIRNAVVIGAGLAGATVARALALRGVSVTVLEQSDSIASGASGNRQAVVQLRLNRQADALAQFNIHSYLYALRYYAALARHDDNQIDWHACGVITLDSAYTHTRRQPQAGDYAHYSPSLLQRIGPDDIHQRTQLTVADGGTLQPGGGWLNPQACTRFCLEHPLITVRTQQRVARLNPIATSGAAHAGWQAVDAADKVLAQADAIFVCNSFAARELEQTRELPVYPLRGQVSYVKATDTSRQLTTVVCGERYVAPVSDSWHCVGASYVKYPAPELAPLALTNEEHRANLSGLGSTREQLGFALQSPLRGRASLRGSSGDYMPMIGLITGSGTLKSGVLGSEVLGSEVLESEVLESGVLGSGVLGTETTPGVYASVGHGSHGTTTCPLAAEHLAALACGEFSPLARDTALCVEPARFEARRRKREQRLQHQNPRSQRLK